MKSLWVLVLVACAGPQHAAVPADPPQSMPAAAPTPAVAPAAAPAPAPSTPPMDEATLVAKSHAWLDAFDRFDIQAFTEPLGPTFILYEDARFIGRGSLSENLQHRVDDHWKPRTRTWSDEHTYISSNAAIFIGRAVENIPAEADHDATTQDGYNTVVWVPDGNRWVIAHWQWGRAGLAASRDRWNDAFRQSVGFNKKPNQLLVDTVKGRKPGTALDIGMGQGRNAVFLASQGWKTTGIDIADEGIKLAKAEAAKRKVKLDTIEADIDAYDYGVAKWDLITMVYEGTSPARIEKIKPALKKGGLFVFEYFHADSDIAKTGAGGAKDGELAAEFKDGFKILRDEVVDDVADWSMRKTKLVRFVAQKL